MCYFACRNSTRILGSVFLSLRDASWAHSRPVDAWSTSEVEWLKTPCRETFVTAQPCTYGQGDWANSNMKKSLSLSYVNKKLGWLSFYLLFQKHWYFFLLTQRRAFFPFLQKEVPQRWSIDFSLFSPLLPHEPSDVGNDNKDDKDG